MSYKDQSVESGVDICNAFADFFNSNYLPSSSREPRLADYNPNTENSTTDIHTISISSPVILKLLKSLDCNKSAGPDGLHPYLLKNCAECLVYPINILFNKSVSLGTVPKIWKTATVTPIHKKGSKRDIANYRPISKLCVLAKILERLVHDQIYAALKQCFSPQQHGFLKGRSTTTNLISFIDTVTAGMEGGGQVDAIYTDYSKAFDRIDHSTLLEKLNDAGIRGDLFRWLTSYVGDRCQTVALGGYTSVPSLIPSGVPQGSILGPLLFIIFINDIGQCFQHSNFVLYADDMKIYKIIKNRQDAELLQSDLDNLHKYCLLNKLDLNILKCCCITFSRSTMTYSHDYKINGQALIRTDSVTDLGVTLDSKLLFDKHIENITVKATKTLGFILRVTKDFKLIKTLKILFCSLVRSQLEYASQVWNPCYDKYISLLEKPQRKFLRFINFKAKISNSGFDYEASCRHHHLLPLLMRREAADLSFLHNIVSNRIDCSSLLSEVRLVTPSTSSRKNYLRLRMPCCRTNYRRNSFFSRTFSNFNTNFSEHIDLFATRHNIFKYLINIKFFGYNIHKKGNKSS